MSINVDKKGRIHLYIRYKDLNGIIQREHFSKQEWKFKKDAKAFQDEYLRSLGKKKSGQTSEDLGMTVNDLYKHYIKEQPMKVISLYNYNSVHRLFIKNSIGKSIGSEVNIKAIKAWQKELLSKGFANAYLGKIQGLLRATFNFGVRHEYIDRNPFLLENIKVEETKHIVQHWTPQEFEQFIQVADNQDFSDFFTLLYWTGLRFGEAVALTVSDFDPVKGTITVSKTFNATQRVVTSPKTNNSYRSVVCSSQVQTMLTKRIRSYSNAYGYDESAILFGFHTHLPSTTMQHAFERYINKSGVKRINIHALRHSHVYMLRKMGFDAFDIAKRLGHSVEMVNEHYGQWFDDTQREMVKKMDVTLVAKSEEKKKKLVLVRHYVVKKTGIYQEIVTKSSQRKITN